MRQHKEGLPSIPGSPLSFESRFALRKKGRPMLSDDPYLM